MSVRRLPAQCLHCPARSESEQPVHSQTATPPLSGEKRREWTRRRGGCTRSSELAFDDGPLPQSTGAREARARTCYTNWEDPRGAWTAA